MQFLPPNKKLILASKSPRRQQLLRDLGFDFEVRTMEVNENHDASLNGVEIAEHLAEKKALAFKDNLAEGEIVLTSDTVVWCNGESLAKAENDGHAREMLQKLSGTSHEVITGVCLLSKEKSIVFSDITKVYFREITIEEIDYYIKHYRPFDKAGAYGIQEWIGMWAIEKIEGSYFTVMGLPTHLIQPNLMKF
ncbi:Maf family nucleotide pyrophosphatase [Owenweeksia hongkongensis]|uniref:Maf family nucleotide pyrophosphatase n=1 Tax=Owenweeksia hongkongensis TaxID=253245 RepID=UPI003A8E3892